jgi:hypothetical protein
MRACPKSVVVSGDRCSHRMNLKSIDGRCTDRYELTMAAAYWRDGRAAEPAVFDSFFRTAPFQGGDAVFAGLETLLDALQSFRYEAPQLEYLGQSGFHDEFLAYLSAFSFRGTIWSVPEGEVVFPLEPVLRVEGGLIETQIIETLLLNVLNELIPRYPLVAATQDWHPPEHLSFASSHAGRQPFETIELDGVPQTLWPDHCQWDSPGAQFAPALCMSRAVAIFGFRIIPNVDSLVASGRDTFRAGGRCMNGRNQTCGDTDQRMDERLATCGLRLTPQRQHVYAVLWSGGIIRRRRRSLCGRRVGCRRFRWRRCIIVWTRWCNVGWRSR